MAGEKQNRKYLTDEALKRVVASWRARGVVLPLSSAT
jgi:hypothetical protein